MNTSFEHKDSVQTQRASQHESQSTKAYPSRTIVRAKLEMTEPGDHDEQEADAVANTVVNGGKIARKISNGGGGSSGIVVSTQMESQLSQLQGGGRQMPESLRNMMESGFGHDFSQVRLHTDSEAASMSSSIHAKAFTLGNDIYFNRGQFNPNTSEGQRLVAHELTHVVQGTGKVGRQDVNEEQSIQDLREYLDDNFIHREDENIKETSIRKKDVTFRADGNYKPFKNDNHRDKKGKKKKRKIIDCDVYAHEIISYLENNVYNSGRGEKEKIRFRSDLAKQINSRKSYDYKCYINYKDGFVNEVTMTMNYLGKTHIIPTPIEIFDPNEPPRIKKHTQDSRELEKRIIDHLKNVGEELLKKAGSSPILGNNDHKYYPIKFEGHAALLFKHGSSWYVSDNNIIKNVTITETDGVPTGIENAINYILELHQDANFTYYDFNETRYYMK